MKIELQCSVDPLKDFLKMKGDKSGRVWFDVDSSQADKFIRLVLVPDNKLIKVTIEF